MARPGDLQVPLDDVVPDEPASGVSAVPSGSVAGH
jgi:hypothetical protein